jgi:hypothetical protein
MDVSPLSAVFFSYENARLKVGAARVTAVTCRGGSFQQ